jgi:hypothetical protein
VLLCITNDDQLMKNYNDFVKIKFYSHENIEWHCMQLEFKLNWIEFESIYQISSIQFEFQWV